MDPEYFSQFHHKLLIEYRGYQIVIYENTTVESISKFMIGIFQGGKKIGALETNNDKTAIAKVKTQIDRAEDRGEQLIFMEL